MMLDIDKNDAEQMKTGSAALTYKQPLADASSVAGATESSNIIMLETAKGTNTHERNLLRVARLRDKQAFAALFEHFAPRVKSYLIKLGLPGNQAEDLAQDVLVTMWQKANLFDPEKAKVSTWLFRIARNKYIDLTRKRKFPEVCADDHLHHMVADDETDKGTIHSQNKRRVASALQHLNTDQRRVVELSFFEELTHQQMSDKLGIPLGTVKSRLRLAFRVLRNELREE